MPNIYESDRLLSEYLLFHYGDPSDILPYEFGPFGALDFPKRCVDLIREFVSEGDITNALDLGCAVGRSSFELARFCRRVLGVDFSKGFIEAANNLKAKGELKFQKRLEGDLSQPSIAKVPEGIDRKRVEFAQGDACNLPINLGTFQVALLANLIDRLPSPTKCLDDIANFLSPGGVMVITSPYTWMEQFAPKKEWLGGYTKNGKSVVSLAGLQDSLQGHFELLKYTDLPFLIREHERKFQWSVAQATVWRKK